MIKIIRNDEFPYKNNFRNTNKLVVNVDFIDCIICNNKFYDFDKNGICRACEDQTKNPKSPTSGVV